MPHFAGLLFRVVEGWLGRQLTNETRHGFGCLLEVPVVGGSTSGERIYNVEGGGLGWRSTLSFSILNFFFESWRELARVLRL